MRPTALTLALLLAAAVPGRAADSCRDGASLLGDQRALAALRATVEDACPCAAATARKAWQSCAKGVVRAAVDAATLRPECKRTANSVNRGATCGSDRVACGRVDLDRRTPVSCKVTATARCTDGRFDATVCADETFCADVTDWTAGTCVDPRDLGPYVPGVRVIRFVKQSVQNPSQTRTLDTVVWYPAAPGSGPITPPYSGVADAPLDPSGGPYPLVLFSHGSCGYPSQSQFLTPLLASHGFVVAAPPHPGNTIADFPTCGSGPAQAASYVERPNDVIFVTDQLLAADADPASFLYQAIDETRLGMSGHSFGGLTTFLVQERDPRFRVAMPMAPATIGTEMLTVPTLVLLGAIDAVVNNPNARAAFANGLTPKFLVEIENTGHYAFSDACFASPDCNPPVTLTQAEAHARVLRWALPFLEVYLAGDESFRPFLAAPPPPGFTVTAQP
jgi:predicted dienelactone hydrolase